MKARALFDSYPWRTFRSYDNQKHYSGTYWSSTLGDHVIYDESRLELANLMIADFVVDVKRIAAQPFMLTAKVNERTAGKTWTISGVLTSNPPKWSTWSGANG